MSTLPPNATWIGQYDTYNNSQSSNTSIMNAYDHVIVGKMFLVSDRVSYDFTDDGDALSKEREAEVKYRLTEKLLRAMIDAKYVEFTKSFDQASVSHMYRARCFVTPDAQIKILRTQGIK